MHRCFFLDFSAKIKTLKDRLMLCVYLFKKSRKQQQEAARLRRGTRIYISQL